MPKILIAEDSMFQRKKIRGIFKTESYELLEATNGKECLNLAVDQQPDCIILDLLMPEMDGMEVLAQLKAQNINIPVIIHSADIQESTQKVCFELGAVAFVNKPIKEEKLLSLVKNTLVNKNAPPKKLGESHESDI